MFNFFFIFNVFFMILILGLISFFSSLFASPLSLGQSQIESLNSRSLVLNDSSVWETSPDNQEDLQNFQNGDLVIVTTNSNWYDWFKNPTYTFRLINQRTKSSINLKNVLLPMLDNSATHYLIALDLKQKIITLNDQLNFMIHPKDLPCCQTWILGDFIFIGINSEPLSTYQYPNLLINLSLNSYIRVQPPKNK